MKTLDVRNINILVLAYLGDTIYEDYIRKYLIGLGINNVDDLQKKSIEYVSAKNQALYLENMCNDNFFKDEELDIIMRARNNKTNRHPKNCDIITYKYATGLEAVIGYLTILERYERIDEIMKYIGVI